VSPAELTIDNTTNLDALFPAGVKTVLSLNIPASVQLWPAERQGAARFSATRLAEFRHGRDCARRALSRLGAEPAAIPIGTNREPTWPTGVTGSITHAGAAAAAAVAWQSDVLSLGLDLEPISTLEEALTRRICRPAEIERELAHSAAPGETAKLIFSAKEAAYKALWPVVRQFLDFHDLEVALDLERSEFTVLSQTANCAPEFMGRLEGKFTRVNGLYATGVSLRVATTSVPSGE
jgi:4'-phosphopantetheinyl transferase EntD